MQECRFCIFHLQITPFPAHSEARGMLSILFPRRRTHTGTYIICIVRIAERYIFAHLEKRSACAEPHIGPEGNYI